MTLVITWQAPNGETIDVTPEAEEKFNLAGVWPRNAIGEYYCKVSHGLHRGVPDFDVDRAREFIEGDRASAAERMQELEREAIAEENTELTDLDADEGQP